MDSYEKLNLYPHNISTCDKIREAYESGEDVVSIIKATGTGKTYIGLNLALENQNAKTIWLVPTNSIKEHIEKVINNNPNLSMEKDFPNLEIRTYTSLSRMKEEEIKNLECDFLIIDELHHIGAPIWGEKVNCLINTHDNMKTFGMSAYSVRDRGTPYERDMTNPDTEEIFSDTVVDRYDLYDAIIDGVLPMPFVKSLITEKSSIIKYLEHYKKLKKIQDKPIYHQIEEVIDSVRKTIHKQEPVKQIVQDTIKENGKYIYFCPLLTNEGINDMDTIINTITNYIKEKYPDKKIVVYKTTSDMGEYGKYNRDCFYYDFDLDGNDATDAIRIMFAKNQYNEGVHAPNIDGVFLGRETNSDIIALEQIGRALSVRENIDEKRKEYGLLDIDELKKMAQSRGIKYLPDITKEYLIELLVSPTIIDLADNIDFLEELETNLKDRIKEKIADGSLDIREIKIPLDVQFVLDVYQRDLYKSLKNIKEQIHKLSWYEWYELAKNYYDKNNNSNIPRSFKTANGIDYYEYGFTLGRWCYEQRKKYQAGDLDENKIKKLEEINFKFEVKQNIILTWDEYYDLAKAYYNHYGDLEIPSRFKTKNGVDFDEQGMLLGSWLYNQRTKYNCQKLSEDKIEKLKAINIRFKNKKNYKRILTWDEWYDLAKAYYDHYGNLLIPLDFKTKNGYERVKKEEENDSDVVSLGRWYQNQKNKKLSSTKQAKLKQIGFIFGKNTRDIKWEKNLELLKIYYNHHHSRLVPLDFKTKNGYEKVKKEEENDPDVVSLGTWCDRQRELYKQKKLLPERFEKLKAFNFPFELWGKRLTWDEYYELLLMYIIKYGDANPESYYATDKTYGQDLSGIALGSWCENQRIKYRKNKLTEEQIQKLVSIGFRIGMSITEEKNKKEKLCREYNIYNNMYHEGLLEKIPYQELYSKIQYLEEIGQELIVNNKLHEIFKMSNENMILKYMISKEEMIIKYYLERKGKQV